MTTFILTACFLSILGGFIIWGLFNEKKLIALEAQLKRRALCYIAKRIKQSREKMQDRAKDSSVLKRAA